MSVSECIRKVCGRDCAAAGVSWAGGGAAQHQHHNNESIVRFKRLNPAVHRRRSSHQLPGKADAGNFPVREEAGSCGERGSGPGHLRRLGRGRAVPPPGGAGGTLPAAAAHHNGVRE